MGMPHPSTAPPRPTRFDPAGMVRVFATEPLTAREVRLLAILATHAHDDGTVDRPSIKTLAKLGRMTDGHVSPVLASLISKGFVVDITPDDAIRGAQRTYYLPTPPAA